MKNEGCLTNSDCCDDEICSPDFKCIKHFQCSQELIKAHFIIKSNANYSTSLGSEISLECNRGQDDTRTMEVICTEAGWLQKNGQKVGKCSSIEHCQNNADCHKNSPFCDVGRNKCVECITNEDCGNQFAKLQFGSENGTCVNGICNYNNTNCGPDERFDFERLQCLQPCKTISSNTSELDIGSCCSATNAPERCIQIWCLGLQGNGSLDNTECISFTDQFWQCQELKMAQILSDCFDGFQCKEDGFCHPTT